MFFYLHLFAGADIDFSIYCSEHEDTFDVDNTIDMSEMIPRIDISSSITEALLTEIADKNWKNRNEGLTKLQGNCH